MADAVRPDENAFCRVLQESLHTWSSYLDVGSEDRRLPQQAIALDSLVCQTPPFLGGDSVTPDSDEEFSFACQVKRSLHGNGHLVINGRSTWRTSKSSCDLPPKILSKQLLLAVDGRTSVKLSEESPFSDWPGVQGLSGYDGGNYLAVLYLAWAYILSARWIELLGRSADHECEMRYSGQSWEASPREHDQSSVEIELAENAGEEEIDWWRAILCSGNGWNATTKYDGQNFLSPWSVSFVDTSLTLATATRRFDLARIGPPGPTTALNYLTRFCMHHRLYAQCSVALVGVLYMAFKTGRTVSLPYPRQHSQEDRKRDSNGLAASISDLLNEHRKLLPKYMTLSSNPWGLRSILHSTFFNPEIDCNLTSAWLNPAFAIIETMTAKQTSLATFLSNRDPRLGVLWVGAIFMGLEKSILRDIWTGMVALDLSVSTWVRTSQTFLTSEMGTTNGELISRDDECRLLFITASGGHHDRPPISPWRPFGATQIDDTELSIRQHAQCYGHCLEYDSWEWMLTNGGSIRNPREEDNQPVHPALHPAHHRTPVVLDDLKYNFLSQSHSELSTRGIFGWLRSTGYPPSERPIYQHSWIDLETTDEEEPDDAHSDVEKNHILEMGHIENWLDAAE